MTSALKAKVKSAATLLQQRKLLQKNLRNLQQHSLSREILSNYRNRANSMQSSDIGKSIMSPMINERMRKRRCFADKELEMVMLERERQAEVLANHRRALHHMVYTHNQQLAHLNGLRKENFQQQSAVNLMSSQPAILQEGLRRIQTFQGNMHAVKTPREQPSPKEFLQKVFPAHNPSLIELVWQGCGGDLERTIEQLAKGIEQSPRANKILEINNSKLKATATQVPVRDKSETQNPVFISSSKTPVFHLRGNGTPSLTPGAPSDPPLKCVGFPSYIDRARFCHFYSPLVLPGSVLVPAHPSIQYLPYHALQNAPNAKVDVKEEQLKYPAQRVSPTVTDPSISRNGSIDNNRVCQRDPNRNLMRNASPLQIATPLSEARSSPITPGHSPPILSSDCTEEQDKGNCYVKETENVAVTHHQMIYHSHGPKSWNRNETYKEYSGDNEDSKGTEISPNETNEGNAKKAPPLKFSVEAIMSRS
ncbi:doublesex- and mab-3-related transcription factor 2-like [Elysia marginata]|uniref:Doublesex- and mab-3-related transcription factor 2-like n=1 Tax=Elysia marginata TaxID=1093978 RepID=A0AAV4GAW4_9GAST|nr:doublesex- and mab-3-related transcription factor 2-like [Elysia marginata]